MKYLKRIFESNKMDDMKKYIYECFVDFLDENAEAEFDDDQDLYNHQTCKENVQYYI